MRIVLLILLLLAAHFSLTALLPGPTGKGTIIWPFGPESRPVLSFLGSARRPLTQVLAVLAGACFLLAALALFGLLVPATWWTALVIVGAVASILLHLLYVGPFAILPLILDGVLLWGVLAQGWTVASLSAR